MNNRILIVEDDTDAAQAVVEAAHDLDSGAVLATTFADGLEQAMQQPFDLIVIDRMLPGGDGIDAIAKLRANGSTALILVVSALGRAANKIEGLEKGADDYLSKPFDPQELRARMRALLRRNTIQSSDNDLIAFGDLQIRLKARTVHFGATYIAVSPKEFDLLMFFARNEGLPISRMQLLEKVWNLHFDPQTNVVDVHVGRLRRKLEAAANRPLIHTSRGQGYTFSLTPPERG